jgi:large subunit ribosomal protein L3
MSETQVEPQESNSTSTSTAGEIKLTGLFAQKVGMSSVYTEAGQNIPVTVLKVDPWKVTQIKTQEKEGYNAIQIATFGKLTDSNSKALQGHNKKVGEADDAKRAGSKRTREIRVDAIPEGVGIGNLVSIDSLQKGDVVKLTSKSKGRGFTGAMKRWNFAGGPASHGSKFHRRPGSAGTRTWPGFVLPGKRGPGHFGDETVTIRNVQIVEVNAKEGVILVKGPVPGARNTLVRILKQ